MGPLDDLRIWDVLTSDERDRWARTVAGKLPPTFLYRGLRRHELGDQSHEIAFFGYEDATFALLPGGTVTLGYGPERKFIPCERQAEEWKETEAFNGCEYPLEEYLEYHLTPLRTVALRPFLIEIEAKEYSEKLSDDAECEEEEDWAEQDSKAVAVICAGGFRLPTPDEWEYACSGGTTMLFRWGNETPPSICYNVTGWDLHKRLNAFGLVMNHDTYVCEVCDGFILRGGDGGDSVCGGYGTLATWIRLATAFACPIQEAFPLLDQSVCDHHIRRVFPL